MRSNGSRKTTDVILIIDNFDSFVHNLARYVRQLGHETLVVRNDDPRLESVQSLESQLVLISPGPATPDRSGYCLDVVKQCLGHVPLFGVCLGHQTIVQALGGRIVRAQQPMHGQTTQLRHHGHPMFDDLPAKFQVARYHSLVADRECWPACLESTAECEQDQNMAFAHRDLPVAGVQFHPESILTEFGYTLLANCLQWCGLNNRRNGATLDQQASIIAGGMDDH